MSNELERIMAKDDFFEIDTILQRKPHCTQIIKYYWIAITNNQLHKMKYIEFKSRLHRTETIIDFFTSKIKKSEFKIIEGTNTTLSYLSSRKDIFNRLEWVITKYDDVLWNSRAPFENFLQRYILVRDDILNLNQDGECNDSIKINRTEKNLMKETVYIAQELIIMSEFIKNDIDRNDDLLFKITIFVLNGMILAGQLLWKNYVDDSI
jgi:hypothetical protein